MRRLTVLIVLILLLTALVMFTRTRTRSGSALAAEQGTVMYAAAFDGFLDEWQQYEDGQLAARVEDGRMLLAVDTANGIPFSLASPTFGDFDVRVEATALEGPLNNAFGVMFRFRDSSRQYGASWMDLIARQVDELLLGPEGGRSFYQFLVSSDGFYSVRRWLDGEETVLSNWIDTDVIRQGLDVTNTLRVVARGNTFAFFINGEPAPLCIPNEPGALSTYTMDTCIEGTMQDTLTDDSVASGQIGLVAQSFEEPGVVVAFDNLVVSAPDAET